MCTPNKLWTRVYLLSHFFIFVLVSPPPPPPLSPKKFDELVSPYQKHFPFDDNIRQVRFPVCVMQSEMNGCFNKNVLRGQKRAK